MKIISSKNMNKKRDKKKIVKQIKVQFQRMKKK